MAGDKLQLGHPTVPPEVDKYLVPTEKVVFQLHLHWTKLAKPVGAAIVGFILLIVLDTAMLSSVPLLQDVLLIGELFLIGRALWQYAEWRRDWFIATDRRLILTMGIITRRVAMMPLAKVTDMTYERSPIGKALGYGTFVLESAGQDQAFSTVNWVPTPDMLYRRINEVLFTPPARRVADRPPPMGSALPIQEANDAWWKRR